MGGWTADPGAEFDMRWLVWLVVWLDLLVDGWMDGWMDARVKDLSIFVCRLDLDSIAGKLLFDWN